MQEQMRKSLPVRPAKKAYPGITLAETLVALGLLGIVMIPVLFASSAFFTSKLVGVRQKVGVAHDASVFINRFLEEMYFTNRLLPDSTSTELHYTFYDPVTQTVSNRGYLLKAAADGSGDKVLARLTYNGSNWSTQTNPYGAVDPEKIHLPSTAVFSYCDNTACSPTVNPEKAVFVRLSNWQFAPQGGGYTLDMPTSLDVYLSAGASSGGVLLSDTPRALYSFAGSSTFGSGADLKMLTLSAGGGKLGYFNLPSTSTAGTLTTILGSGKSPGELSTVATSTGRVYFGENGASGRFMTWSPTKGLSVLVSGVDNIGYEAVGADSNGRVFFGQSAATGSLYTWAEGSGLSVIYTGVDNSLAANSIVFDASDRAYFGGNRSYYTWKASTGLTTLATSPGAAGYMAKYASTVTPDGKAFFSTTSTTASMVFSWDKATSTLTTIFSGAESANQAGFKALAASSTGRVYFGENNPATANRLWTWKAGSGLTTLVSGTQYPGRQGLGVGTDERVFFGESGTGGTHAWTWKPGGSLSTLVSGENSPGWRNMYVTSSSRALFGQSTSGGPYWTWDSSTGLSTLMSGNSNIGSVYKYYMAPTGRFFIGVGNNSGNGSLYSWNASSGLSLLATGLYIPGSAIAPDGYGKSMIGGADGSLYFSDSYNNTMYHWSETQGLVTILSGETEPGNTSLSYSSYGNGTVFFGETSATGSFWAWSPKKLGYLSYAIPVGTKTGQATSVTLSAMTGNYTSVAMDADGVLYMLNNSGKTMDRFTYDSSTQTFKLSNSLSWAANASTVGAMSVDNTSNAMAILDIGNKQIDVYSNRKTSGAATPTSLSLASTTTPTGLAYSNRSGNYLVLDSALQSGTSVRLYVYNSAGTQQTALGSPISINVTAANLGVSATTETNFKISYDDRKNILYLTAPTVGRVYALTLPARV